MELPDVWALQAVRWQFFATLTFSSYRELARADGSTYTVPRKVPGVIIQQRMVARWLRHVAADHKVHFLRMLWAIRSERGELLGREHLHLLIAGLPPTKLHLQACYSMAQEWERIGGGQARVRIYDGSRDGLEYMCKGLGDTRNRPGANVYEMKKFCSSNPDRGLMVSESVWRVALSNRRRAKCPASYQREQGLMLGASVLVGESSMTGDNEDCHGSTASGRG